MLYHKNCPRAPDVDFVELDCLIDCYIDDESRTDSNPRDMAECMRCKKKFKVTNKMVFVWRKWFELNLGVEG